MSTDMPLMQAFITDHDEALEELFGDVENPRKFDICLTMMATRIATVFASLKVWILYPQNVLSSHVAPFYYHQQQSNYG